MKDLTATFKMKNTFLIDKELIKICYNSQTDEHLKVKYMKDLVQRRHNIDNFCQIYNS